MRRLERLGLRDQTLIALAADHGLAGDPAEHYAVMVPEGSLREGRNRVEVFEVAKGGALRLLAGP